MVNGSSPTYVTYISEKICRYLLRIYILYVNTKSKVDDLVYHKTSDDFVCKNTAEYDLVG